MSFLTLATLYAVKFEACLEDGTVVVKPNEVEFTVKDGMSFVEL